MTKPSNTYPPNLPAGAIEQERLGDISFQTLAEQGFASVLNLVRFPLYFSTELLRAYTAISGKYQSYAFREERGPWPGLSSVAVTFIHETGDSTRSAVGVDNWDSSEWASDFPSDLDRTRLLLYHYRNTLRNLSRLPWHPDTLPSDSQITPQSVDLGNVTERVFSLSTGGKANWSIHRPHGLESVYHAIAHVNFTHVSIIVIGEAAVAPDTVLDGVARVTPDTPLLQQITEQLRSRRAT